jgi:hypothetical protein
LESAAFVQKRKRYCYHIDGREVDFSAVVPVTSSGINIPVWLARNLGLLKIAWYQALPAVLESIKK